MTRPPAVSAAVVAAVVAGLALGFLDRPDAVRDVALPAAVIGLVSTVAAMVVMAARGTAVLEGRFLVAWVVTAVIGAVIATGVSWGVGRVTALAR